MTTMQITSHETGRPDSVASKETLARELRVSTLALMLQKKCKISIYYQNSVKLIAYPVYLQSFEIYCLLILHFFCNIRG